MICPRSLLALLLAIALAMNEEGDIQMQRLQQLLEAVRSGEPAHVRDFVQTAFTDEFLTRMTLDSHVHVLLQMHRVSPELEIESRIDQQSFLLFNRLEQSWERLTLEVEDSPPHRISGLRFARADPPFGKAPPLDLTDTEIAEAAESFLARLATADVFSGTVLIAHGHHVLFRAAYGQASKRYAVQNDVDTRFYIASITKALTATAVLRLVESGKLSLDDTVSAHLGSEWIEPDLGDRIRIEHLLSHTSGLGDWDWNAWDGMRPANFDGVASYRGIIPSTLPTTEPGTRFAYSNSGYILLGAVIEAVTGETYRDFLRTSVLEPAGMSSSGCFLFSRPVPNIATGYVWDRRADGFAYSNNTMDIPARPHPAGGVYSNADDLLRFVRSLREGALLSESFRDLQWSGKPELGSSRYGFGFMLSEVGGERVVGHSGGYSGVSTNLDHFVEADYTVVVLSNYENGKGPVVHRLRELISKRRR
jgi:CubicO group peptidase (beta-lactamase class C family)